MIYAALVFFLALAPSASANPHCPQNSIIRPANLLDTADCEILSTVTRLVHEEALGGFLIPQNDENKKAGRAFYRSGLELAGVQNRYEKALHNVVVVFDVNGKEYGFKIASAKININEKKRVVEITPSEICIWPRADAEHRA